MNKYFGRVKLPLITLTVILLISVMTGVVLPAKVSAVSVYDNIHFSNGGIYLKMTAGFGANFQSELNLVENYTDFFTDKSRLRANLQNQTTYDLLDDYKAEYDTAVTNNYAYGISFTRNYWQSDYYDIATVYWATTNDAEINFSTTDEHQARLKANTIHRIDIAIGYVMGDGTSVLKSYTDNGNLGTYGNGILIASDLYTTNGFINQTNVTIHYPPNWGGSTISNPPINVITMKPVVSVDIDNKRLRASILLPSGAEGREFVGGVKYSIFDNTGTNELFNYSFDGITDTFVYDFDDLGGYVLKVDYQLQIPYSPEAVIFITKEIAVSIDGTSYLLENNVDKIPRYKDCNVYGGISPYGIGGGQFPDIIGGIGCHLGNFGKNLEMTIGQFFIPDRKDLANIFNNKERDRYGILGVVLLPITTIQKLTTETCSPITIPLPNTDKNITLQCLTPIYQSEIPILFNLYQTIITGVVGYAVAINIIAIVKRIRQPEDDGIEVFKL